MFEVLQVFKHYKQIDEYIFFIRANKSQTARAITFRAKKREPWTLIGFVSLFPSFCKIKMENTGVCWHRECVSE